MPQGGQPCIFLRDNLAGEREKFGTFQGQRHFARRAVKKVSADLIFQFGQTRAGDGRGKPELTPCRTDVQRVGGHDK